jgi:hypothetical protein
VLLSTGFEHTVIESISISNSLIELILHLPYHTDLNDFLSILPNLQQELSATDFKITNTSGKRITVHFGKANIDNVPFNAASHIKPNTLQITLASSFGDIILDFADGASCHMLNGGLSRMGKTMFLLYVATLVYYQNNGNIHLYITSPKAKDFYPLSNLQNVEISNDITTFEHSLDTLINEYKFRNQLLYSPALAKATDTVSVKEHYPHMYKHFLPVFLIIDEYSRFNYPEIHKKVEELVSTAGYVNIHVIIATQRPEARITLPANIKQGLNARICFRTADTNNSVVILDEEGAETLPNIKGRAILRDGEKHIIQVPKLTYDECIKLLKPYERNVSRETTTNTENIESSKGSINTELSLKIQNMLEKSIVQHDFPTKLQPDQRMQSNDETINNGWFRLASTSSKR